MQPLRESAVQRRRSGVMPLVLALSVVIALILAACAGTADNGTDIGLIQTQEAERNAPPPTVAPSDGTAVTEPPAGETPTDGGPSGGDPAAGQQVAQANGCLACHSVDGSALVGPTWQGLFGSQVTLADGSTVTADAAYIAESIRNPNAKVHEGFTPTMPAFAQLSDADITNIVAYIESLQ